MTYIYEGIYDGLYGLAINIAAFEWELLFIWCILMALDIIGGAVKACRQKKLSSNIMRRGLYKKLLDSLAIIAVMLMQSVASYMGINAPVGSVLMGAFCVKELVSILENAAEAGTLPKVVSKWMANTRN